MESNKQFMILTALLFFIGIVHYNLYSGINLSPGENQFPMFYVVLFILWAGIAVFIITKHKMKSKENKEKIQDKELSKKLGKGNTKKLEKKLEKKITAKLEKKMNEKVKKEINKKTKKLNK